MGQSFHGVVFFTDTSSGALSSHCSENLISLVNPREVIEDAEEETEVSQFIDDTTVSEENLQVSLIAS